MRQSSVLKETDGTAAGVAPRGEHHLVDLYNATNLDDEELIAAALVKTAEACGATVIDVKMHKFGGGGGVTGVVLLAESHISIHTWPESGYAAIDVFACTGRGFEDALECLKDSFCPEIVKIQSFKRGI